jgi:hypothetical protein
MMRIQAVDMDGPAVRTAKLNGCSEEVIAVAKRIDDLQAALDDLALLIVRPGMPKRSSDRLGA